MLERVRGVGGNRLGREICVVLVVKLLLITLIWYCFFSEPIDDSLSNEQVGSRLLGAYAYPQIPTLALIPCKPTPPIQSRFEQENLYGS